MSAALSTEPDAWQFVAPACLVSAAAVAGFLGAVLAWPPPPAPSERLTVVGTVNVFPEHDVTLYLGVGVAFLALMAVLAAVGGRRARRGSGAPGHAALVRAAVALTAAVGATVVAVACFAHANNRLPAGPRIRLWELALFGAVVLTCMGGAWVLAPRRSSQRDPVPGDAAPGKDGRLRWQIADLVVPVLVVAVVYLPGWRQLAGNAFVGEEFLHIDYFAMGPAIAFEKGVALGSAFHPYYGVGWALALTKLPLVRTLSYGHFIHLEVIYGCIYFIGVYALLRVLTRSWQWATAGTALAILLQIFGSFGAGFFIWRFPSATVLRWAFDIWFFLVCLLYLRTRKEMWLVAGGVVVGLALMFQTETGLYLGLAAGFLWLCAWRMAPGAAGGAAKRRLIRTGAVAVGLGVSVFGLGLGVASRWTFLSGSFWSGWLENLQLTQSGATLLPLTGVPGRKVLLFFALMTATYLAVAGYVVMRFVHRRLTPELVLLGTMAIYGFLTLLYFVGRSNPHNLFRPAVPFAIVLAGSGAVIQAHLRRGADSSRYPRRLANPVQWALPWLTLGAAVVMLVQHPGFRSYPNLLRTGLSGGGAEGRCLVGQPEVCGLDAAQAAYGAQLEALAGHLRTFGPSTRQVAILDTMGPLVYNLADARPWGRYVPMFYGLFFKSMVQTVVDDLRSSPPDIVVMRSPEQRNPFLDDIWQAMRPTVEQAYVLDRTFGPFEVWERRVAGTPGGRVGSI